MHQRGTVLSFLVVAVYASFVVVSPVLAVEPYGCNAAGRRRGLEGRGASHPRHPLW
jgi:hypothetical protein